MADRYKRTAYEKIWDVIQVVQHYRLISGGEEFGVSLSEFGARSITTILKIFHRLEDKDKVIKIIANPEDNVTGYGAQDEIEIRVIEDEFDKFFVDIEKKYKRMASNYQESEKKGKEEKRLTEPESIVYEVKYLGRKILINDFLLSQQDFNKENEMVFSHLYQNPNKTFSLSELKKKLNINIKKSLKDIVKDLGFKGDFKKIFFEVVKTKIMFKNPIKRKDLEEHIIDWLRITPFKKKGE